MTVTLTQVLLMQNQLLLFGQQVSDFYLRGDLGLGLEPGGPIGFAWIHAMQAAHGTRQALPAPLLMSVHGPGEASGHPSAPDERCWRVDKTDLSVRMLPSRKTWAEWLGLGGDAPD
jgi:hypothetical protein